jgi:hypothetical protein
MTTEASLTAAPSRRYGRAAPLRLRLVLYSLATLVAVGLALSGGDGLPARELREYADDAGPVQRTQAVILGTAVMAAVWVLIRVRRRREPWAWASVVAYATLVLFIREAELEQVWFGTRAFSWGGFFDPERPLGVKLGLYLPTLLATLAMLVVVVRRRPDIREGIRRSARVSGAIGGAALLLGATQVLDLGRSIRRHFGLALFRNDLLEEVLELVGEAVILFALLEWALGTTAPTGRDADAQPPRSPQGLGDQAVA